MGTRQCKDCNSVCNTETIVIIPSKEYSFYDWNHSKEKLHAENILGPDFIDRLGWPTWAREFPPPEGPARFYIHSCEKHAPKLPSDDSSVLSRSLQNLPKDWKIEYKYNGSGLILI